MFQANQYKEHWNWEQYRVPASELLKHLHINASTHWLRAVPGTWREKGCNLEDSLQVERSDTFIEVLRPKG